MIEIIIQGDFMVYLCIVQSPLRLFAWFGQFGMAVGAARAFGVFKEGSNPCTTGKA